MPAALGEDASSDPSSIGLEQLSAPAPANQSQTQPQAQQHDQLAMQLLFCVFCGLYAYFFQGGGWNQNSHFDAVRSMVERHTVEITPIARNTGDVGFHDGKVYSNKGPGLAALTAPVYFVLYHLQRALSEGEPELLQTYVNAQILAFFASGLPGVMLVLVLYSHFRRAKASAADSLCLAAGFGAGTLVFPYSGLMMSHIFTACALFTAWHILSDATQTFGRSLASGVLVGAAVITDVLATPVALLLLFYATRRHARRELSGFVAGAGLMACLFLTYNRVAFGSIFKTNQNLDAQQFQTQGLLFGMLGPPEWMRLYWLSFHPFRGVFHCCPVLLLPFLSLPRSLRSFRRTALHLEQVVPLLVVANYVLFNLSFNGWTGGWGVGPRYMIPMVPFLYVFALSGFRRVRLPAMLLMALSSVSMFCVAAVRTMVPAPSGGQVPAWDPVADCIERLAAGQVSISTQGVLDYVPTKGPMAPWASYNLGEVIGLRGLFSVVPALLLLGVLIWGLVVFRQRYHQST